MPQFDKSYWEDHWIPKVSAPDRAMPVNPYLAYETEQLIPGTALDAGCGTGAEAVWLAQQGWQVTGADISATALQTAATRAAAAGGANRIEWFQTDVARWEPHRRWDLVTSHYAHPDTGQLPFYQRLGSWVAQYGSLLLVGHHHGTQHENDHPEAATVTLEAMTALFPAPYWSVDASYENTRTIERPHGAGQLHDVVVRVRRLQH